MSTQDYLSKEELKDAIHIAYQSLDHEFDGIEHSQRDNRMEGVDRTPAEIIAYQLGWLHLVMKWDKDEKAGLTVITPSPDYKWNQLGGLYQSFYHTYAAYSLDELRSLFQETEHQWQNWIDSLSDEELLRKACGNGQETIQDGKWSNGFILIQ